MNAGSTSEEQAKRQTPDLTRTADDPRPPTSPQPSNVGEPTIFHLAISDQDRAHLRDRPSLEPRGESTDPTDYRIQAVSKPWGFEYLLYETREVSFWFVHMRAGLGTSLHSHPKTSSSIICCEGIAVIRTLDHEYKLYPNQGLTIEPGAFHSLCAEEDISVVEALWPSDRQDLVRLRDFRGNPFADRITHAYHSNTSLIARSDVPGLFELLTRDPDEERLITKGEVSVAIGSHDFLRRSLHPNFLAISLSDVSVTQLGATPKTADPHTKKPLCLSAGNWLHLHDASRSSDIGHAMDDNEQPKTVSMDAIYLENSHNWRYFLDWRHRMMVRLLIVLAALLLSGKWLLEANYVQLLFVPTLLSAGLFFVTGLLDRRNAEVARMARRVAERLEKATVADGGFYMQYPEKSIVSYSYTAVLKQAYRISAALLGAASLFLFVKFKSWHLLW